MGQIVLLCLREPSSAALGTHLGSSLLSLALGTMRLCQTHQSNICGDWQQLLACNQMLNSKPAGQQRGASLDKKVW